MATTKSEMQLRHGNDAMLDFKPIGLLTKAELLDVFKACDCAADIKPPRKGRALLIACPNRTAMRVTKQGKLFQIDHGTMDA